MGTEQGPNDKIGGKGQKIGDCCPYCDGTGKILDRRKKSEEKRRESLRKYYADPVARERMKRKLREAWTEEKRKEMSERMKARKLTKEQERKVLEGGRKGARIRNMRKEEELKAMNDWTRPFEGDGSEWLGQLEVGNWDEKEREGGGQS